MAAPHDNPTAAELTAAVRDWLSDDVAASDGPPHSFHRRVATNVLDIVRREIELGPQQAVTHADRLARLGVADDRARQVLERHESTHLHVADVGQAGELFAASDVFAAAPVPADDDARERRADIGAPDLVVDLSDADLGDIGIADRKITIRFGLFELEFGYEIGALQLTLAAQLALELPDVDLGPHEQRFLFGALLVGGLRAAGAARASGPSRSSSQGMLPVPPGWH